MNSTKKWMPRNLTSVGTKGRGLLYREDDEFDQKRVHIQAGKETFPSWVWSNVFGLQFWWQEPNETSFKTSGIPRIQLLSSFQRPVSTWKSGMRENSFKKANCRWKNSWSLKPDVTGRGQAWDKHHHNLPLIQSTQQFLGFLNMWSFSQCFKEGHGRGTLLGWPDIKCLFVEFTGY